MEILKKMSQKVGQAVEVVVNKCVAWPHDHIFGGSESPDADL